MQPDHVYMFTVPPDGRARWGGSQPGHTRIFSLPQICLQSCLFGMCRAALTFVHAGIFVLYHRKFVDLAELFKNGLQVLFLQIARNLPDEQLDRVGLLH